jgi:uncharacterized protein
MRQYQDRLIFSATDLVTFLGCRHATFLDHQHLLHGGPAPAEDPYLKLLQEKGHEHERGYRDKLRTQGQEVVEVPTHGSLAERTEHTRKAMAVGADVIYQGSFLKGRWHGYADFLLRVPGHSALGEFHYEPLDTKLSHSTKPKHVIQLGVYADLIADVQKRSPERLHVALGNGDTEVLPLLEFRYYLHGARERFEKFVETIPDQSKGEPCSACSLCRWKDRCESEWKAADHLSQVARITASQIEKLNAAGITTLAQLAALPVTTPIPCLQAETLSHLCSQAHLQDRKRRDGENHHELLPPVDDKGFARLPPPNPGDLYFDMEGDPLLDGGLEYLFGFAYRQGDGSAFVPFWGHNRHEEKIAFEKAIDFITARLAQYPEAHIYHYAQYEKTALEELAMRHGTREAQVDDLLRRKKLVDLYKVVREALRVSEPGYSLKNIEVFYMPPREGEVTSAGASVMMYERWRKLQDPDLLEEIERYNEVDCVSTLKLHSWLLTLRASELPWRGDPLVDAEEAQRAENRQARDERIAAMIARLLERADQERDFRELVSQLLEFHRREAKPKWWWQFRRDDMSNENLTEDAECIGGLRRDARTPPFQENLSTVHTFTFPPQDFKLRVGDRPRRAGGREPAGEIFLLDETARRIQLKLGPRMPALPDVLSLIPGNPFRTPEQRKAVYRYAEAVVNGGGRYKAVTSLLKCELPRIKGRRRGNALIATGQDTLSGAVEAIAALKDSYLLVQGPPGTGKTYLSATAIVNLLAQGHRVGVTSNSHKAINRLLEEVVKVAQGQEITLRGVKKCSDEEDACHAPMITNVYDNDDIGAGYNLVGGTAWLMAREEMEQSFDYLFIDEAGQVSLANVVAMGLSARNLVLVGDQMQLAQPIQGVHPGKSGSSALEYVLEGYATVPPERGVFLDVTRRMHPDVCRFISEAVYEGRLHPHVSTYGQRLILTKDADPALKPSGLSFVAVSHQDCRQKCPDEAQRVFGIYMCLLQQRWINQDGEEKPITLNDILVVSPYNMQVNLLQSILPLGARVGTVDKFQGQEAAAVIVSMTTSSGEDVPRGIDFLYSRNRLNVAISRARALAIVVASPLLLEAPCARVEDMELVNTLCFASRYALDT